MIVLVGYSLAGRGWLKNAMLVLGVLFVIQCLYIQSMQQAWAWVTQRHDYTVASALTRDIMSMVDQPVGSPVKVDFHGKLNVRSPYPRVKTTTLGESFFEWDQGNPMRMVLYMKMMGFYRYEWLSPEEKAAMEPAYAGMPVWPRPGSVRLVDGVVVVKLSE
jgi:hypothetical protein